ncbi:MAG: PTS sugar transporter subunit IIB [Selenomonas sp.]|jgi:PTS system ascorbate-specific IIB component|uniref:PTS sugar transporter subunit IIB n=1 Tax=Selenomonas ruminantium TaxID=971 RepID=A0A927WT21_SELRU|nr:PTS sugar transporter subunit IIB [Selenomonas ruminantium]MBQ1417069.1 PTS sugar transporter subunit IIB [Selenomonas sp.]MBE6092238.1 PTS sugar transporter subunit IIB [Selenomonas ruminantium]MBQ1462387.1 PTS sugar transporter subunit IIB [Selenomonas sp.]MBQ1614506.1 PTS sugar transporter subunit IIB [Selenomonas sp.]MBQ2086953.1 PTS sugar transporter subunit IIB [Selenomonas sp.]
MAKLKVIAACGSGMGSSQIIKMKLEKVFKKLGLEAEIYHTNVGDAKSQANNYDVVFCSESLVGTFTGTKAKVIGLKNLLAEKEMEEKIKANIVDA